ncbi:mitochondrial PGP phosphatase-domain-containing protein [Lactarius akahatsu]|uniref:Mitochondrial PGP phosphatase-domain-containing protein n=1 Tax=Lactarius akahatsu TaxID=416441 RepID=A0AAD4LNH1_9AGAM|nr:mitochondrial PGP phosphatase-domain-containing protein [Lactarius akahatsu]
MPFNLPGTLVPFYALLSPRILLPSIHSSTFTPFLSTCSQLIYFFFQRDIRHLDFAALRDAGYRGAIFDKDNCLTLPNNDKLVPQLEAAWSTALRVFGPSHVLIVSNSAGTSDDPAQLQAESVAYHLRAPVLLHAALKPSYACANAALSALPDLAPHEIVVVGDRVFTDVVLAHRLAHPRTPWTRLVARLARASHRFRSAPSQGSGERGPAPLAVWTTGVWQREKSRLVHLVERWVEGARHRRGALEDQFVRSSLEHGKDEEMEMEKPVRGWFSWARNAMARSG